MKIISVIMYGLCRCRLHKHKLLVSAGADKVPIRPLLSRPPLSRPSLSRLSSASLRKESSAGFVSSCLFSAGPPSASFLSAGVLQQAPLQHVATVNVNMCQPASSILISLRMYSLGTDRRGAGKMLIDPRGQKRQAQRAQIATLGSPKKKL